MFAKIINDALNIAPKKLLGDGVIVYNPPAEMYLAQGWKPVRFVDEPEAPSGYHYDPGWSETSDEIVQTWTLVEDPDDVDEAEAWEIVFGSDNE